MRVLIACEFSGIVRDAFRERGHDAMSCDLMESESPGDGLHYQGDVRDVLKDAWDLMIAHPPCTYLTCAGNKWSHPQYSKRFPNRAAQRLEAITLFLVLANAPIPMIAIENPVGVMSTEWRRPDQIIQPYQFGVPVRKTTCLWLKGLPKLKAVKIVSPVLDRFPSGNCQSRWHTETGHIKDSHERMKARSRTFPEIAKAMAEQWENGG